MWYVLQKEEHLGGANYNANITGENLNKTEFEMHGSVNMDEQASFCTCTCTITQCTAKFTANN